MGDEIDGKKEWLTKIFQENNKKILKPNEELFANNPGQGIHLQGKNFMVFLTLEMYIKKNSVWRSV